MDIDMLGVRYVMGFGLGQRGPAMAVNHNSRRCYILFLPFIDVWEKNKEM